MTTETLNKVTGLLSPTRGIRTGDLVGLALREGLEPPEFWAAMQVLEKDGKVRSRMVPHKKNKKVQVAEWILANTKPPSA